jgi:hypothetical protein
MYRYPVHRVELIMGQYLSDHDRTFVPTGVEPRSESTPLSWMSFFFALDKEANGFEREHPAWGCPFGAIHRDSLLCCVVTDTVKLCLPTEIIKGNVVVLMCFYVQVVSREGSISAVEEDVLEDV